MGLAAAGKLDLVLVCLATTTGAVLGDLAAYSVGRVISRRAQDQVATSTRGHAALRWLEDHEQSWGPALIVGGRFVPGGTTAVGVSAGLLVYPVRRFVLFAGIGAVLWTAYGVVLGFLGAAVFPGNTWAGVLLAAGIALGAGGVLLGLPRRGRGRAGP